MPQKLTGLKAKIATFPLASAHAVVRTVQAVYRPIKLDASIAQRVADFQAVFRPPGKFFNTTTRRR